MIKEEEVAGQAAEEAEQMVKACEEAGVQFMDGTMWVHNPRAALLQTVLSKLGPVKTVTSTFSFFGRALTRSCLLCGFATGQPVSSLLLSALAVPTCAPLACIGCAHVGPRGRAC